PQARAVGRVVPHGLSRVEEEESGRKIMRYVTRKEMQEIDRRAIEERKIPVDTLMAAAGKAVADLVEERISRDCTVVAVCGRGNNGGDGSVPPGLVPARELAAEAIALQNA